MKLVPYWRVWYLTTDEIWHQTTYELVDHLGSIRGPYFDSLEAAEKAARRLTNGKDILAVEVREERSVLSFPGAAHGKVF